MSTPAEAAPAIRELIASEGGRFTSELGLDVDNSPDDVERWFVAASLFGAPIQTKVAVRTWRLLDRAGIHSIGDAAHHSWDELVALLGEGGYTRYDFRTATRLQDLARAVTQRLGGRIGTLAAVTDPDELESDLDGLPGWGPRTVEIFLRELRGVWPGAKPRVDERARRAAGEMGLDLGADPDREWDRLAEYADAAGVDPRDLEAALVRNTLRRR